MSEYSSIVFSIMTIDAIGYGIIYKLAVSKKPKYEKFHYTN
jgi:hypothetical protein